MVAASRTQPFNCDDCCVVGELGLDGTVRPVKGVLSIALEAKRRGRLRVLVPVDRGNLLPCPFPALVLIAVQLGTANAKNN